MRHLHPHLVVADVAPWGTVCHAKPVQYSTVRFWSAHDAEVIASLGSTGFWYSSWTPKTSTSEIVRAPANETSSVSGNVLPVASCQPLPVDGSVPQWMPRRSPLIVLSAA